MSEKNQFPNFQLLQWKLENGYGMNQCSFVKRKKVELDSSIENWKKKYWIFDRILWTGKWPQIMEKDCSRESRKTVRKRQTNWRISIFSYFSRIFSVYFPFYVFLYMVCHPRQTPLCLYVLTTRSLCYCVIV